MRPNRRQWRAAVLRPTPVNLAVAVALLLLPWAVALVKVPRHHLDSGAVGLAATFCLGLPALWLGAAGYWVAQREADRARSPSLTKIAEGLAGRLRSQWAAEAEARGLNDPYPLPVSWAAAEAPLAGDLDALKKLATSGAGWSASARDSWATGPEDLAGGGDKKLADVLASVPTGRLVVLGDRGSGKTMLMVGLVLDLLARRRRGGPIPVLVSLASWDPVSQDLHGWLGATLITSYPDLAGGPPPASAGGNRFEALLEAGLILPVLDGLDEIAESARPVAITRINKELRPGEPMVVSCRTEEYRAAVSPRAGQGAVLRAAVVQLSTLRFEEVASYLRKDAGSAAEGRWAFLDTLSSKSPVRQALVTPLMAGLARTIYNPRLTERATDLPHPAELRDFADRAAVEAHLFDAFIPAAYRLPTKGRWKAVHSERWLVFLARHLEYTIGGPDLAWWHLQEAAPLIAPGTALGLYFGWLAGYVFGLAFGPAVGTAAGLVGLAAGFVAAVRFVSKNPVEPARGIGISGRGLAVGLAFGLAVGFPVGFAVGRAAGLTAGLTFGLATGLAAGFAFGFVGMPRDLAGVTTPDAVLARDRQVALLLTLVGWVAIGLVVGVELERVVGLVPSLVSGLAGGLAFGIAVGITGGLAGKSQAAWPSYILARWQLAFQHQLPLSLMDFLADAHQRGVLRQAGAVYQFRHIELQHRLAKAWSKIGSYHDVQDVNRNKYRVTLVKVIDPARGADQRTTPENGRRFVGAVFTIKALSGSPEDVDANNNAAVIGSDGLTYPADLNNIAGHVNFDNGTVHMAQYKTVTGSVAFQLPEGVKAAKVQWTPGSLGSLVQWEVRR
jgi:NACHT domain-containing protein